MLLRMLRHNFSNLCKRQNGVINDQDSLMLAVLLVSAPQLPGRHLGDGISRPPTVVGPEFLKGQRQLSDRWPRDRMFYKVVYTVHKIPGGLSLFSPKGTKNQTGKLDLDSCRDPSCFLNCASPFVILLAPQTLAFISRSSDGCITLFK